MPDRKKAACRDAVHIDFFADDTIGQLQAKSFCERCEERITCLDWGMARERFGIWGGLTEKERRQIKRRVERVRCIDCGSYDLYVDHATKMEICLSCGLSWRT